MSGARLFVLGAGAWGTALAQATASAGNDVHLWMRSPDAALAMAAARENSRYLPGVPLAEAIQPTASLTAAEEADAAILVVPAQHLRQWGTALAAHLAPGVPLLLCAKGIEAGTGALMSEVARECLPGHEVAVLSGPTFAAEVARGLPTAVTLACADQETGWRLVEMIGTRSLRPYWSHDVIGAEVGGAVKNVLAIACGITLGMKLGDNARAALVTRGLAEIGRLSRALGGERETLMGLSGLGDLTLTCNSPQSRNMSLGIALGEGKTLADILASRVSVAEGASTAGPLAALAARLGVDMPICGGVRAILEDGASPASILEALLSRPFRAEAN